MSRLRLCDLSQEQRDHIRREDATRSGAPVVSVGLKGHGRPRGGRSAVEMKYGARLHAMRAAGEILSAEEQPEAVVLPAHRCTYTADYRVVLADGSVEFHEVKVGSKKGPVYYDGEARLKTKLAARVLSERDPPVPLVVVWPVGKTWRRKVVKP